MEAKPHNASARCVQTGAAQSSVAWPGLRTKRPAVSGTATHPLINHGYHRRKRLFLWVIEVRVLLNESRRCFNWGVSVVDCPVDEQRSHGSGGLGGGCVLGYDLDDLVWVNEAWMADKDGSV